MKNSYQLVGCLIAFIFPFAANSLLFITRMPLLVSLLYYLLFGIYIRFCYEDRLPYLKPQFHKVKIEIILFILLSAASMALYIKGMKPAPVPPVAVLLPGLLLYGFINGTLEHLIWVNIYDLCGKNMKYIGVIAATVFVILIHFIFWNFFVPSPLSLNSIPMFILQLLTLFVALRIYDKTRDLTVWSIQHIIYDFIVVIFGGFSLEMYLKLLVK